MIHFFPTFSKEAKTSPFARELASLGVNHKLFPGEIVLRYRSRIWLVLMGWPKLFLFATQSAIRSLFLSKPYPDTVVIGSHIEGLVFGLFRLLRFKRNPEIVLLGFILTSRPSRFANALRTHYFKFIFSFIDKVICYSSHEVNRYRSIFQNSRSEFLYVPFGLHVEGRIKENFQESTRHRERPFILSAGRSGRDYATLFQAVADQDIDVHVVCDNESAVAGLEVPNNVSLLRHCYGKDYIDEIINSLFVVIPLKVNDISAGQMVLLQAMAFGKSTVVTKTTTIEEYVADGKESLLVEFGNADSLRSAIEKLIVDKNLVITMGKSALAAYENKFSMKAYVFHVVRCITLR